MNKTTQIHIGGRHFFMDEDAFGRLNHYLNSLKLHFTREGDVGKEIVDDIEQRIAELLDNKFTNGKQSVNLADVNEIITTLGMVEDFSYAVDTGQSSHEDDNRKNNRRLFRDSEDYYIGGVAGGLAEYFNIDPLWVRLSFVALIFLKGVGLLVYLILWIVVPKAITTTDKLRMKGKPVNLSTIKDSVNEEYERLRFTSDKPGSFQGQQVFENVMRAAGIVLLAMFKFFIAVMGIFFLVLGSVFLAGLVMMVMGFTNGFGFLPGWHGLYLPNISQFFATSTHYYIALISLIIVFLVPIAALIYGGVKILFNIKGKHPVLRASLLISWIIALILLITMIILNISNSPVSAETTYSTAVETGKRKSMVVNVRNNLEDKRITRYWVMGYHFNYSRWDDQLFDQASLKISLSNDKQIHLDVTKRLKNIDPHNAQWYADQLNFNWSVSDSVLLIDRYFYTDEEDFWLFPEIKAELKVPAGFEIVLKQETCDMLVPDQKAILCGDKPLVNKRMHMSPEGELVTVP